MKNFFSTKIALISITLIVGVFLGWAISPATTDTHAHEEGEGLPSIWTCSMHPQIRLPEAGDCPICGMDLIPGDQEATGNSNPQAFQMTPEALALAQVQTLVVGGAQAKKELILSGKLQADERENASLTAKFSGRIEKLFVTFTGEQVTTGQRIATVYSPELLTAQKELLESAKTKATFPQLYQASKDKLGLWKLSATQIAEIERSGQVKERMDIFADQSGVVLQKNVSVGDYVSMGSVLFTVTNLNSLWLMLDVYETDLPFVALGDEIQFTVAGKPGETLSAKVTFVDPLINANTRAASVRAEIRNVGNTLKPEMFVTARIQTRNTASSTEVMVPRTAVLWSGKRSIVYVKVPNAALPEFVMREVTLGNRLGENYQITAGLQAGEEIVSYGAFALDASAQLSGKPSLLNRSSTQQVEVSAAFSQEIAAVVSAYFQVKNSLVKDQIPTAATQLLAQALAKVSSAAGTGKEKAKWEKIKAELSQATAKIKGAKDIGAARTQFSNLSASIIQLAETYPLSQQVVYKDYCPMAFDNKGGYWLSETEDIRNPYFGASMLSCGEVKQTYQNSLPSLTP
ncbi:MAG: efflux RND transporter periplasmic adaptor subunit [Algoriphagus sp.]|nr:efflux RND transporter periplasmic adaptor subunit [Algoriphagus sp.]